MDALEKYQEVFRLISEHHKWMKETINLIASENIVSQAVKEAMISDFSHRYAEGMPGDRVYAGCKYIDPVEEIAMELAKELFGAEHANVQPVSGVVANLVVYSALTEPGDKMVALKIPSGGHISMGKIGAAGKVHGLRLLYFEFDNEEMNIDVDKSSEIIRNEEPKLVLFGASVFLFPHPVKELSEVAKEVDAFVAYDASHVLGLIAGGKFQDPLREGAQVISSSTHKTFPGPQHGIVLCYDDLRERIDKATFPGLVSNHHLHNVAGLAIALAEMMEYGKEYSKKIIENAKSLAQALYERGFDVLCEHKGFTESHQVVVDVTKYGLGGDLEKKLERANIIVNRNLLPWDLAEGRNFRNPGGLRLGTSEVTRLGMGKSEMEDIAEFMKRVIIDKEGEKRVAEDVREFRREFQEVKYCFESGKAYEYLKIRGWA